MFKVNVAPSKSFSAVLLSVLKVIDGAVLSLIAVLLSLILNVAPSKSLSAVLLSLILNVAPSKSLLSLTVQYYYHSY